MEPFKNLKNFFSTTIVSDNQSKETNHKRINNENLEPNLNSNRNESNQSSVGERKEEFLLHNSNDDNEISGVLLFERLNENLNKLVDHFKYSLTDLELSIIEKQNFNQMKNQDSDSLFYMISPQFLDTTDASPKTFYNLAIYAKKVLKKCVDHYEFLNEHVLAFDISENIKFNGYRSLMMALESCCKRLLSVVNQLNITKLSFLFNLKLNKTLPGAINIKDLQTWIRLMEKIEIVLQIAYDIQKYQLINFKKLDSSYNCPSLFYEMMDTNDSNSSIETNLLCLGSVYQDSFFGRTCGFQFCDSLRTPLTGCAVALASYNDGYEFFSQNSSTNIKNSSTTSDQHSFESLPTATFIQGQATLLKSLVSGTKYMMDPELRAKKISQIMKDANVEFCKAFWQLTESDIVQMGSNMITPNVGLNVLQKIQLSSPLTLPKNTNSVDFITNKENVIIKPPDTSTSTDTVQIRILSHEIRDGMQKLDELKTNESTSLFNNILSFQTTSLNTPKSPNLIFHIHGGGFIAHSSKSHEIYLKPWCKELKVPIVSVDYSLAPEHVFPRASEECFYAYAWCLLNKDMLGWTGKKIILVGDSAGGCLVTNVVQRAINSKIRIPDVLIPIYTPFLSTYSISPSRLMSVMDPLLNLGILWRCLAAYSGIDFKQETEKFKSILNFPESDKKQGSDNQISIRSSSSIASLMKTTPLKAFLSRSSTQNKIDSFKSPPSSPSSPTTPTTPTSPSFNFNIRYSKREPFEQDDITTKESVNIEVTQKSEKIKATESTENKKEEIKLSSNQKKRLLQLHKMLGDSVFLIERLRNQPLGRNPYMSPLLSETEILSQFPKTYLITTDQDPLLDDSIAMYKKLKEMNVECDVDVLEGLHHGFLNFIKNSKDCLNGSKFIVNFIKTELEKD